MRVVFSRLPSGKDSREVLRLTARLDIVRFRQIVHVQESIAAELNFFESAGTNALTVGRVNGRIKQAKERALPLAEEPDFRDLIERLYPRLHRAALALTRNSGDADDLTQETMLQMLRSWDRFAGKSQFDTWMYAILVNLHRKHLRRRSRTWRHVWFWFKRQSEDRFETVPSARLELSESRVNIWSAVEQLPLVQRQAVVLRYCEELTYEQIAQILGCPVGTVKSRLYHALSKLKDLLGNEVISDDRAIAARVSMIKNDTNGQDE